MSAQTGEPFEIWQNRISIQWGEQWKQRIREGIETATVLIPVITPSWFNSATCREEFEAFREVEKHRGRRDLILPLIYIATPQLKDATDPIAAEIVTRQFFDISNLHNKRWIQSNVGQRIADMALAIRDTLSPEPQATTTMPSRAGCLVECEHVLQTWGYSPFWPTVQNDIPEEHLLRIWLRNHDSKAANFLEGSVNFPVLLGWDDNPLLEGKKADTSERRVIPITNEELSQPDAFGGRKRERKPLLPKRRMVVHEERLFLLGGFVESSECSIIWELGADSNEPANGQILFRDIPVIDERGEGESRSGRASPPN